MKIKPFKALRPEKDMAAQVASPPYDVVDTEQAIELARDNPLSFLHVVRSEIDLNESDRKNPDMVYSKALHNFQLLIEKNVLAREADPSLYVYRLSKDGHAQHGIVACCSVEDYEKGVIKRHEKTREDKEADRAMHVSKLRAHTGQVFLAYRQRHDIDMIVDGICKEQSLFDFEAIDGVRHTIWRAPDAGQLVTAFDSVAEAYIADGHHRAASAARVAQEQRADTQAKTGTMESDWFPCVIFPANQLRILPYNRCVSGLHNIATLDLPAKISSFFTVTPADSGEPEASGHIRMYFKGQWYDLSWQPEANPDPVKSLDVNILQTRLLAPVFGIENPRTDPHMDFVGGIHEEEELKRRVDSGKADVAFSLWPVSVEQLMAVSDSNKLMPPKSTWFEPKLRSGLLVHTF